MKDDLTWRRLAAAQDRVLTRGQLAGAGVSRRSIAHRLHTGIWTAPSPTVIVTQSGDLHLGQLHWLGVLHGGRDALVGGLSAAAVHGLRSWERDTITILVPEARGAVRPLPGFEFIRTRHDLGRMRRHRGGAPVAAIEPSVLLWAARQRSERTASGVVAAVLQQRVSQPDSLHAWIERLAPLRHAMVLSTVVSDFEGGSQSVSEADVRRMCRRHGLTLPRRQTSRLDAHGKRRFTDCEWSLPDGRTVVLEVDGSFHMSVTEWAEHVARSRALSTPDRAVIHCTGLELRDDDSRLAADLRRLGVAAVA